MIKRKEWIKFVEVKDTGKTKIFEVYNKKHGGYGGQIRWYGGWRGYAYYPENDSRYDSDWLYEVAEFIDRLMLQRKLKKL